MDIRHIRYFLAVAEEQNFTRAAAKIGIGQPPLSQQIKDLEREIGAPLFHRLAHGAELTEVGKAFHQEAVHVLSQVERAKSAAQSAARGITGRLRVGFSASAIFNAIVPTAIRAFQQAYPEVNLSLNESNTSQLLTKLANEELDVVFIRPGSIKLDSFDFQLLDEEPMKIVLPHEHPLAMHTALPLMALRDEPFVMFPRTIGYSLYDEIIVACRKAGFDPKIGQVVPQISSVVTLVAAGLGVSIVPASIAQVKIHGIEYLDIEGDAPIARLAIASRRHEHSIVVQHFKTLTLSRLEL